MIYLDSCLVIYLVEEHPRYGPAVEESLSRLTTETICISPLVEMECLVLPTRRGNSALLTRFSGFFQRNNLVPMPEEVYLEAARLRAHHAIKTPDALHLAAARFNGCTALWTNDDRLAAVAPDFVRNVLHTSR